MVADLATISKGGLFDHPVLGMLGETRRGSSQKFLGGRPQPNPSTSGDLGSGDIVPRTIVLSETRNRNALSLNAIVDVCLCRR